MQIATWNVQWAGPRSARGPRIAATLDALDADIIVLTEARDRPAPPGTAI